MEIKKILKEENLIDSPEAEKMFNSKEFSTPVTDNEIKSYFSEEIKEDFVPEAQGNSDIPVEFITDLISKGWTEIGDLKTAIESIAADFKNDKSQAIQKVLQDLSDAYLICIGQLETYLDNTNTIEELPVDAAEQQKVESEPNEDTATLVVKTEPEADSEANTAAVEPAKSCPTVTIRELDPEDIAKFEETGEEWIAKGPANDTKIIDDDDMFNLDFGTPDPTNKITDDDIEAIRDRFRIK